MLWTGIYFLVLVGIAVWYLFDYLTASRRRIEFYTAYHEPSSANIDQYLPNEIIEHVFTFLDCSSILTCRSVNKYWKFQASKENVLKEALDTQRANNRRQFNRLLEKVGRIDISIDWMEYNKSELFVAIRDHAFATSRGATLLELSTETACELYSRFRRLSWGNWTEEWKKYLIKTIGSHSYTELGFMIGHSAFIQFASEKRLEIKPLYKDQFDLIFSLTELITLPEKVKDTIDLLRYRPRRNWPFIAGFIPTTPKATYVSLNYLLPCLLHDWLNSSYTTRGWIAAVTYIFSTIFVLITIFRVPIDGIRRYAIVFGLFQNLLLPLLAFQYYYQFSLFKSGVIAAMGLYILQDVFISDRVIKKKHYFIVHSTVLLLYLLIFDWRMIYDRIIDGSIRRVILINVICYLFICWEIIWINFAHVYAMTRRPENESIIKMIFKWDRRTVWGLVKMSSIIVISAFYYPVTVI